MCRLCCLCFEPCLSQFASCLLRWFRHSLHRFDFRLNSIQTSMHSHVRGACNVYSLAATDPKQQTIDRPSARQQRSWEVGNSGSLLQSSLAVSTRQLTWLHLSIGVQLLRSLIQATPTKHPHHQQITQSAESQRCRRAGRCLRRAGRAWARPATRVSDA